jgi:hypothetical protein
MVIKLSPMEMRLPINALAGFLGALRQTNRAVPISAAEALLLIAGGIDNIPDLQQAMQDTEGNALPPATISRLISLLRGRARYDQGSWVESPYSLLEVQPHPHRRGLQLRLSDAGERLIHHHFDASACAALLGGPRSTCDKTSQP